MHKRCEPRWSYLLIPGVGLVLLALFSLLYVADTTLYARVLAWIVKKPFQHPFIDWEWIPSAAQCWQSGVDVYVDNTCYGPVMHGRHGYSPLWLRMTILPYDKFWVVPFGLSFAVLFFAALATLPPQRRPIAFGLTFLATLSPLTAFALERANVDVIMFLMVIAGVNCWLGTQRSRLAGYGIFIVSGLLKFYPFVLMVLALRERPRAFASICAATLAMLSVFGLAFHEELARVSINIPAGMPFGDMFAATELPYGLVMIGTVMANNTGGLNPTESASNAWSVAGPAGLLVLTLVAIACAVIMERRFRLTVALDMMPRREAGLLAAGALLVCGCFFAGQNVGYRAIMILPTLPGLLWLGRTQPTRAGRVLFMGACGAIAFVMWVTFIQQMIARLDSEFGIIALIHWLINQLAWWSVVTTLLAVSLGFLFSSEMGRLAAHCLRTGEDQRALPASAVRQNRIALDTARVLTRTSGRTSERDATQETGHEIRHLL